MNAPDILRERFQQEGFACFDMSHFFPELYEAADGLQCVDERAWSYIIRNHEGEFEVPGGQASEAHGHHQRAEDDLQAGAFSFSFRRLEDTAVNAHVPAFRAVREILDSAPMREKLATVTGRTPMDIVQFYISRFDKGNFLYTHRDPGQSFGVVVNLTRQWDPNHGGLTMVLDAGTGSVNACLVPMAFQAMVFDTSLRSIPHFVSMVSASTRHRRIAAVARYDAIAAS